MVIDLRHKYFCELNTIFFLFFFFEVKIFFIPKKNYRIQKRFTNSSESSRKFIECLNNAFLFLNTMYICKRNVDSSFDKFTNFLKIKLFYYISFIIT